MYRASNGFLRSPLALAIAMSAASPTFTGGYVVIDGGSSKVRSLIDWRNSSHILDQANASLQAPAPAAHADFAGKLCLTFAGLEYYDSNQTAAFWKYAHDGTGMWITGLFTCTQSSPTGCYAATTSGATTTGFSIIQNTAPSLFGQVENGAAFPINNSRAITLNVPTLYDFSYRENDSPEYRLDVTGQSAVTGNSASAPDTGNPEATLRLGARASGLSPGRFRMAWLAIVNRVPTSAERSQHQQAIQQYYGVAA